MIALLAQESWSYFEGMDPDHRFVLLLVMLGCATGIVISVFAIVSGVVSSLQKNKLEIDLKREMLDRGMTADEIETVIKASKPTDFLERMADRRR